MSVSESRRESQVASEKRSSVVSSQHMNGHDAGSRRPSTLAPSVAPSASASRRGSAAVVTAIAGSVAKVTSTPSVPKPATNGTKLPPRPLDYDDYYYQDEDGNWQNEYDDEGYKFDPSTSAQQVNGSDVGSRRMSTAAPLAAAVPSAAASRRESTASRASLATIVPTSPAVITQQTPPIQVPKPATNGTKLPPRPLDYDDYYYQDEDGNWQNEYDDEGYKFDPSTSTQHVNDSKVGSRRMSTVAPPAAAVPSASASRRESTASRASLATVIPTPPAVIAQQTPPIQVQPAPYEEEFVEEDEEWMDGEDYNEVVPDYVPEETKNKEGLQEEAPKVTEEVAVTERQSADAASPLRRELPPRPWDYDDYYYQDEDGNWRNEYDDDGYEFDPDNYEEAKDDEFYTEEEIKDAEKKMQVGTQNTEVAMTIAETSNERNQDQVRRLFIPRSFKCIVPKLQGELQLVAIHRIIWSLLRICANLH